MTFHKNTKIPLVLFVLNQNFCNIVFFTKCNMSCKGSFLTTTIIIIKICWLGWMINVHIVSFAWLRLMKGVYHTLMVSHIRDLDAGVASDRASLGSGRSTISNFPWEGAAAAVATGVTSIACTGAKSCRRLHGASPQ